MLNLDPASDETLAEAIERQELEYPICENCSKPIGVSCNCEGIDDE